LRGTATGGQGGWRAKVAEVPFMLGLAFPSVGRFSLLVSYRRLPPALYLHLQSRCAKGAVHEAVLPETQFPYFLGCSPSSHYTCMVLVWHTVRPGGCHRQY